MPFTGHENQEITFEQGAEFTRNYRKTMQADDLKGGYFSKDAIQELLDQTRCVGIRYYYGLDAEGKQVVVLVGVAANEDDLIGADNCCMDMAVPCPESCGSNNILNS